MASTDFAEVVEPWLKELKEDSKRPPLPDDLETTTFPLGGADIEGEIFEINTESSPFPDGALAEEDIEAGRKAYRESGIDVLAFYKSFRFRDRPPFRGRWGIFLIDAGIGAIEAEYVAAAGLPQDELRKLAIDTLVAHERYHFWIDVWALGQEVLPTCNQIKRYEYYLDRRRIVCLTPYDYEESLANHYAYSRLRSRKLSDGSRAGRLIKTLFQESPPPYSDFTFNPRERAKREGWLAAAVVNGLDALTAKPLIARGGSAEIGPSIRPVYARHPAVGHQKCPIYVLKTTGYAERIQPFQGPQLKEFRHFIERYLGGEKEPRSDHEYYKIDNGEKVKFPNPHDKEVRGYELKGTLLKAGMTQSEFRQARRATRNWTKDCPRSEPKPPLGG
ncbi:hypothetical protein [Microbulbifer hydrolyticus]|uniref:Uncharacterized protein n=1 Tax=Microbulbifer hydrolyticus TaxID=48074 RepID=A0A6P1T7U6_9GAMM|nr:hypothetical protein [Microbulbifer hydrolyticus]MBB5211487.1 hypothetical protein [Microbulbifer hydrolyticus]QHQ37763.1 hypothetical protein GTQ55_01350 [Microbulbifer hydrolyticus]